MTIASFVSWADRFESYLVENPKDRFSRDEAHFVGFVVFQLKYQNNVDALTYDLWQQKLSYFWDLNHRSWLPETRNQDPVRRF